MANGEALSAVWQARLEAQRASGLSVAAWCRQEDVSAWSVYAWRKRLSATPVARQRELINVALAGLGSGAMLEMQTPGGYVLRLSSAEQVSWLPAILAAVR